MCTRCCIRSPAGRCSIICLASVDALGPHRTVVVVGDGRDQVETLVAGARRRGGRPGAAAGTAHAVRQAEAALAGFDGDVLILYADTPFVTRRRCARMLARLADDAPARSSSPRGPPTANIMAESSPRPTARSRRWSNIRMHRRRSGRSTCAIRGLMAVRSADLWPLLARVGNDNAAGEYYLPDIVMLAAGDGRKSAVIEVPADGGGGDQQPRRAGRGRGRLAGAPPRRGDGRRRLAGRARDGLVRARHRRSAATRRSSPTSSSAPASASARARRIRAFSHIEGATIAAGAQIGPFARLRPGAEIGEGARVGNFVEVKQARLGKGAKANHLAYLGDAEIGAGANIGAGTITCNYDGYFKYHRPGSARAPSSAPTPLSSRRSASARARSSPPAR